MELLLWQLGGITAAIIALVAARWRERRMMRRFRLACQPAPASTRPPTTAELNRPEWIQPARQPDTY